ncbi:MAG TPA: hypothetical protein VMW10_12340, partial [Alphaproteobacteria bacterium]|nr:hypothetical protein [Alphaproteobacteria bacterium]
LDGMHKCFIPMDPGSIIGIIMICLHQRFFFEMILTPSRFTLPGARPDLLRSAGRPHHPGPAHHIAQTFQPHGVGDCYGCSCPSLETGNVFACEVTHGGFASGPGPGYGSVDVFGICS